MDQRPFVPFVIHMTNGRDLHVPTVDHIAFAPMGGRIVVFENDGTANVLSALHMRHVSFDAASAESVP